ncbi:MAG: hypothetical protein EOM04_07555 [Clostridia bacterium]|nr:hypothetical protein [Clostridia bacterium]
MNYALSDHRQIRLRITSDVISKILNLNKLEEDLYCRKQVLKSIVTEWLFVWRISSILVSVYMI